MPAAWSRPVGVAVLSALVACLAGALLEGPWLWLCAALAALGTALGTRVELADVEPRGVPRASLVLPSVACVSTAGLARLAGASEALVAVAFAGGLMVLVSTLGERRELSPVRRAVPAGSGGILPPLTVILAAIAFVAVAAATPGASGAGASSAGAESGAVTLAIVDAVLAFLLGFRLSTLAARGRRGVVLAGGTFALAVAAAVGFARAWSLPASVAPFLPAAVFLLWSAYRAAAADEPGRWHWVWEYAGLVGALAIAVGWNLLLR